MNIASAEEIQFYQKCMNLGKRIDGRMSNQMRNFELTQGAGVINTCNGSSRLYLVEENFTILTGIKADVVPISSPSGKESRQQMIRLNITSSISKNQTVVEKENLDKKIEEITYYFQSVLDRQYIYDSLVLIEKKLSWCVYIDIYINGYIDYSNIDHLSYSIRSALDSCTLPVLDINLNTINNEYSFAVKNETCTPFKGKDVPHLVVGGFNKNMVYFDLSPMESLACECIFMCENIWYELDKGLKG